MANSAQKNTTQSFTEIQDIVEDIVILKNGNACIVIEIQATNFSLLSAEEQDVKIYSYASLLNSLSFPIQIVVRSKKLNVSNYLALLEKEKGLAKNELLANQIGLYKDFVSELVKVNTILDKKFYMIISYSSLEKGLSGASAQMGTSSNQDLFLVGARASLRSKTESLLTQIRRLNLKADILNKEQLIKLFYEIYNDEKVSNEGETDPNAVKPQLEVQNSVKEEVKA